MLSAQQVSAKIGIMGAELQGRGISLRDMKSFECFWQLVFKERNISKISDNLIRQFINEEDYQPFYDYAQEVLMKMEDIQNQSEIISRGDHSQLRNSQGSRNNEELDNFEYDQSKVDRTAIILIISDRKMKSVEFQMGGNDIGMNCKDMSYEFKKLFAHCLKIPINLDNMGIGAYNVKVTSSNMLLFNNTKCFDQLDKKLEFYGGKKGVIILNLSKTKNQVFMKSFMLRIAKFLHQEENGDWFKVKPWWYLLKKMYEKEEVGEEVQIVDTLKNQKGDEQFVKYFVWLLKNVFGSVFEQIKAKCDYFKDTIFSQNYEFPNGLSEEQKKIERQYLQSLLHTKFIKKEKKVKEWNLEYQPDNIQAEVLLSLQPKFIEEHEQYVLRKYISNVLISVKQFVEKYFVYFRSTKLDMMTANRKNQNQREAQQTTSKMVMRAFTYLLEKCVNQRGRTEKANREEQLFYSNQFNHALYAPHVNGTLVLRLIPSDILDYIKMSTDVGRSFPQLNPIMISALNLNSFKICPILTSQFSKGLRVIAENGSQALKELLKGYILNNHTKLFELIQGQKEDLINIQGAIKFVNDELCSENQLSPKFLKQLLEEANSKVQLQEELYVNIQQRVNQYFNTQNPYDIPQPDSEQKIEQDSMMSHDSIQSSFLQAFVDPIEPLVIPSYKNLFFVMISRSGNRELFLSAQPITGGQKENINFGQLTGSLRFHLDFNYSQIINHRLMVSDQQMSNEIIVKIDDVYLDSKEQNGLVWIDEEQISSKDEYLMTLGSMNYLCQRFSKKMPQLVPWLQLYKKKVNIQNKDAFIESVNGFISGNNLSKFSFELLYGILTLSHHLFQNQSLQLLLKGCSRLGRFSYIKWKTYFDFLNQLQQSADSIQIFRLLIKFCLQIFVREKIMTLSVIAGLIKLSFKMIHPYVGKQILSLVMEKQCRQLLAQIDQDTTEYCRNSSVMSAEEIFFVKTFYLKYLVKPENIVDYFNRMFTVVNQKKQFRPPSFQQINLQIRRSQRIVEQQLSQFFFEQNLRALLSSPMSYSIQRNKECILRSNKDIYNLYEQIKALEVPSVFNIMNSVLNDFFTRKLNHNIFIDLEFDKIMMILLKKPMRESQFILISSIVDSEKYRPEMSSRLLKLTIQKEDLIEDVQYAQGIVLQMIKKHPEASYYGNFVNEINQIGEDIRNHLNFVKKMYQNISIKKEDVTNYIKSSLLLNQVQLKKICLDRVCWHLASWNQRKQHKEEQFFGYIAEAFEHLRDIDEVTSIKKILFELYYEKIRINLTQQQKEEEIWQYLLRKPEKIEYLEYKYSKEFESLLSSVSLRIQRKKLLKHELQTLALNVSSLSQNCRKNKTIQGLKKQVEKMRKSILNLRNLGQIIENWNQMHDECALIQYRLSGIEEEELSELEEFMEKYSGYNDEIRVFMDLKEFKKQNVTNFDSLITEYNRTKELVKQRLKDVNNITFKQMIDNFIQINEQTLVELCGQEQGIDLKMIRQFRRAFQKEQYLSIGQMIKTILFFKSNLWPQTITDQQKMLVSHIDSIIEEAEDEQDRKTNIRAHYQSIIKSEEYLRKWLDNWKNDTRALIIRSTYLNRGFFSKMDQVQLSPEKLKNLKEYSNELQNSIAKGDIIREFRNVFEYWQAIKKCKTMKELLKNLENLLTVKGFGQLHMNIQNCSVSSNMLFQKLEQASDLSLSFKYEVEAILKQSTLIIDQIKDGVELKITINSAERRDYISFEKLSLFKEKSMLVQFNENNQSEENKSSSLQNLKTYIVLFEQINKINSEIIELVNYSYDPQLLVKEVHIQNRDFTEVIELKRKLQQIKEEWVMGIKQIYANSFVLTHFIGVNLVKFVNKISQGEFYDSLRYIINLDEESFEKLKREKHRQFQSLLRLNCQPLQKIRLVQEIFSANDQVQMIDENANYQKIKLITSDPASFYSHIIRQNGQVPLPNQIIICSPATRAQQLEFFVYRSLLNRNRHFIVGISRVSEKVKATFNTVLKQLKDQKQEFNHARLVFIDNDQTSAVYSYLTKHRAFNIEKNLNFANSRQQTKTLNKRLTELIPQSQIVSSVKAGLGKTYYVEKKAKEKGHAVYHFPICGNIDFDSLGARFKRINFKGEEILLIKIGSVINKAEMEIFLSQLIMLRCFFAEEYIYIHPNTRIFIQIENIVSDDEIRGRQSTNCIDSRYYILNILRDNGFEYRINGFDSSLIDFESISEEGEYVFLILNLLQIKEINGCNILFSDRKTHKFIEAQKKHYLVEKYFTKRIRTREMEPTFSQYTHFMNVLFKIFDTFSKNPTLLPESLEWQFDQHYLNEFRFKEYRQYFIELCIDNSLSLIEQTFTQNKFREAMARGRKFRELTDDFKMLIIPSFTKDSYRFVYLKDKDVPAHIKLYNIIQNQQTMKQLNNNVGDNSYQKVFKEFCSYSGAKDKVKLEEKMMEVLRTISRNTNKMIDLEGEDEQKTNNFQDYVLTMDNFFKMCLIVLRQNCSIPCVIEGESGVGKTALIRFLAQNIFMTKLQVFNINAGIHQEEISRMMSKVIALANEQPEWDRDNKIWVFFDEFNTTDELSYIKEIVTEHRFMGEKLPENLQFIAACNPYRIRRVSGNTASRFSQSQQNLAFKVHPPPFSMVQIMWDYQQLTHNENILYIEKMLEKEIKYPKLDELIQTMAKLHQQIKKAVQISAVSLRDVERFKKLYSWFCSYIQNTEHIKQKITTRSNNKNDKIHRPVILALFFCYCLRFSKQEEREKYINLIERGMGWKSDLMKDIINQEQHKFVSHLKIPDSNVAINTALKENTFTSFVCIMNKIPILIIGSPGSSKSLSIRILASNLNGRSSEMDICRKYPEINMIYFQGSESSTSEGVEEVFTKVDMASGSAKYNCLNCIYFDQIGLAQKSEHNPLKVLHSKLEIHNENKVAFIGISNDELDAAKMSRFLVLNRPPPSSNELSVTAQQICQNQIQQNTHITLKPDILRKIGLMGEYYCNFIKEWGLQNTTQKGFFGLRDFYNYVKYMAKKLRSGNLIPFQEELDKAITINFDGQQRSLDIFRKCIDRNYLRNSMVDSLKHQNPLDLVQTNLLDNTSRCLLLIVKGETLLPIIQDNISSEIKKNISVVYGSAFKSDEKSESYNLDVTTQVIAYMAKGDVVVFKDINNSIQSSLYDLFNKSYISSGNKKYCRIAVGANSNPQCWVNDNFNAIVFMDERKIGSLDLPFLNRFQKHFLRSQSIMDQKQIHLKNSISSWLNRILIDKSRVSLKRQNYIFNVGDEALITLILKYRSIRSIEERGNLIKKDILHNRTFDFCLLYHYNPEDNETFSTQIESLGCITPEQDPKDLIIYTYDQLIQFEEESQSQLLEGAAFVKIAQITSEKQLKEKLEEGLNSQEFSKCVIIINLARDEHLIQQILFLSQKVKRQKQSQGQIIVIIQLHRFTFKAKPELKLNISYLHEFNQYFKESLSVDMANLLEDASYYSNLFDLFQMKKRMGQLYAQALSIAKILQTDELDRIKIFGNLVRMEKNYDYMNELTSFLSYCLEHEKVKYELLHTDKEEIMNCSTTLEALENLTRQVTVKYIFVFFEFVCGGNYLKLFEETMEIEGEPFDLKQKDKQMRQALFKIQLQNKKAIVDGQSLIENISIQKQSNQIVIRNNIVTIEGVDKFIQSLKLTFSHQRQAANRQYEAFNSAFKQQLKKYPLIQQFHQASQFKGLLLKGVLSYLFKIKTPQILQKLEVLMSSIILPDNQVLKIFILLEDNKYFARTVQILEILFCHYSNFEKLLQLLLNKKLYLKENISAQINCQRMFKNILDVTMGFTELSIQNLQDFGGAEQFYIFNRKLGDTINTIYEEIVDAEYKIPDSYRLLKNFYDLIDSSFGQSTQNAFKQFVNFKREASIYQRIYSFILSLIDNKSSSKKYESFLSFWLFASWVSEVKSDVEQLKSCIEKYVKWCQESIDFANRSEKFFDQLFGMELNGSKNLGDVVTLFSQDTVVSSYLNSQSHFAVALNNYFIKKSIYVLSEKYETDFKDILSGQFTFFESIVRGCPSEGSLSDNFKIAYVKVYLAEYLNQLQQRGSSEILLLIDQCVSQNSQFKKYCRLFLVKELRINKSKEDIMRNFFDCNRCRWIRLEEAAIVENDQEMMQSKGPENQKLLYLFKTIQGFRKLSIDISDQTFSLMKKNYASVIEKDHPLLHFVISTHGGSQKQLKKFLQNAKTIFTTLTQLKNVCDLKIRRFEGKQSLQKFLSDGITNQSEREKIRKNLEAFKDAFRNIKDNAKQFKVLNCKIITIPELSLNRIEENLLEKFLIVDSQNENNKLLTFVEELTTCYNSVCGLLQSYIQKIAPNSILLKRLHKELDPTDIADAGKLLELPDLNVLKNVVYRYSNYSVEPTVSSLQYFLSQIENGVLNIIKAIPLLKARKDQIKKVRFIGQNNHFLIDMKKGNRYETLKDKGKLNNIQDEFKRLKKIRGETFHKAVKKIQNSLEIVIVFYKNSQNERVETLEELLQLNNITQIGPELKEEPFKSLPPSVLVDLYEFIQAINFPNIPELLGEEFRNPLERQSERRLNRVIQAMKEQNYEGYPTFIQFKNAIYRFVIRSVLTDLVGPEEILKNHLYQSHLWDREGLKNISFMKGEFDEALNIKVKHLYSIVKKMSYELEWLDVQEESVVKSKPKRRMPLI